tara:strand:- start:221 stop:1168 length:948 start_codon:yes stop_codon:yes gene_type:complete
MKTKLSLLFLCIFIYNCADEESDSSDNASDGECSPLIAVDSSRGECTETLSYTSEFSMTTSGDLRKITANNIPAHNVGLFGNAAGALNPNTITPQNSSYDIDLTPSVANSKTQLFDNGPAYSFGILLSGIEVDPVAAEPWPHTKPVTNSHNWDWNLEATMVDIGLDCNTAHVQPTGKYHYHGVPGLYLESLSPSGSEMLLVGWAADGFPIYYMYGHSSPEDNTSSVKALSSSYQLKSGERPGDGDSAPCGAYTGTYTADYEYVSGLGDLDECNGRQGVTPEFPSGTYYYVITTAYPGIPRCFVGTPSSDFRIGPG